MNVYYPMGYLQHKLKRKCFSCNCALCRIEGMGVKILIVLGDPYALEGKDFVLWMFAGVLLLLLHTHVK